MIISVQSVTNMDIQAGAVRSQRADRERLLTMTGTSPERRDDHSLDSGRHRDGSVAMSENLWIALDPHVGSSAVMRP
jgi:hypothetical protein